MSLIDATELAIANELFGASAFAADATLYAALFTTVPADDGSGGTEANYTNYARVSITNNLTNFPSANPKLNGTAIAFPAAGAAQTGKAKALGFFTASSGGTLRAIARLCDQVRPMAIGLNTGDIIHCDAAHGWAADDLVVVWAPAGVTLPAGLSADTEYYVRAPSGNNLQLAATAGGAAIAITADGGMIIARSRHATIGIGDTPSVAASGFSMTFD